MNKRTLKKTLLGGVAAAGAALLIAATAVTPAMAAPYDSRQPLPENSICWNYIPNSATGTPANWDANGELWCEPSKVGTNEWSTGFTAPEVPTVTNAQFQSAVGQPTPISEELFNEAAHGEVGFGTNTWITYPTVTTPENVEALSLPFHTNIQSLNTIGDTGAAVSVRSFYAEAVTPDNYATLVTAHDSGANTSYDTVFTNAARVDYLPEGSTVQLTSPIDAFSATNDPNALENVPSFFELPAPTAIAYDEAGTITGFAYEFVLTLITEQTINGVTGLSKTATAVSFVVELQDDALCPPTPEPGEVITQPGEEPPLMGSCADGFIGGVEHTSLWFPQEYDYTPVPVEPTEPEIPEPEQPDPEIPEQPEPEIPDPQIPEIPEPEIPDPQDEPREPVTSTRPVDEPVDVPLERTGGDVTPTLLSAFGVMLLIGAGLGVRVARR